MGREVEGPPARVGGVVHRDPVDQHQRVVRIQTAGEERRATAPRAGLIQVQPRAMAQHVGDRVEGVGLEVCPGEHLGAPGEAHQRMRLARAGDDQGLRRLRPRPGPRLRPRSTRDPHHPDGEQ